MNGANGSIFAIGDCTASSYAPTAQVAQQQGSYLARLFAQKVKKDQLEASLAELESMAVNIIDQPQRDKVMQEAEEVKKQLGRVKLMPFHYSHQGSLA